MAGAASALFLLDIKGRVLVWRDYRGDVTATQAERFFTKLIEKEVLFYNLRISILFSVYDKSYSSVNCFKFFETFELVLFILRITF